MDDFVRFPFIFSLHFSILLSPPPNPNPPPPSTSQPQLIKTTQPSKKSEKCTQFDNPNIMKREYTDPETEPNPNPDTITSAAVNFPNHHFPHPHQPYSSPLHFPFQIPSQPDPDLKDPNPIPNNYDGGNIVIQRRTRGRPPGSKNKPKPPIFITRLPDPILTPYILEIDSNVDIIDALKSFTRRRNTSISILSATGAVANPNFRQPTTINNCPSSSTVTVHGRFDILSLSATFLSPSTQSRIPNNFDLSVAVSVSVPQGQIFGGIVAGELISSGTVYVVTASFCDTVFLRLPGENDATSSGGNEGHASRSAGSGENDNGKAVLASDVIWAQAAGQRY